MRIFFTVISLIIFGAVHGYAQLADLSKLDPPPKRAQKYHYKPPAKESRNSESQRNTEVALARQRQIESDLQRADELFEARNYNQAYNIYVAYLKYLDATQQYRLAFVKDKSVSRNPEGLQRLDTTTIWSLVKGASDAGVPDATALLGKMYRDARYGASLNLPLSVECFEIAASKGSASGMMMLGYAYQRGLGISKDVQLAYSWWAKAAQLGNTTAMHNLAWCYEHGQGVQTNFIEAFNWYSRAANGNDILGTNGLGWAYEKGIGVEKNFSEAIRWYRKSASLGNALAIRNIGQAFAKGIGVEKNLDSSWVYWRRALALNNDRVLGDIGWAFQSGQGVAVNNDSAWWYYQLAADKGSDYAACQIGWLYWKGLHFLQDKPEAMNWFLKAARAGNANAMMMVGYGCEHGVGRLPKDEGYALKLYKEACSGGDVTGCDNAKKFQAYLNKVNRVDLWMPLSSLADASEILKKL